VSDVERSNIRSIVPYDVETRTRCFVLYATFAARNCAAVQRLYAAEVASLEIPVPDVRTIQIWAAEDDWMRQADDLWRNTKGRTAYELQIISQANTMQGAKALHDILTGLDQRDATERVITLKAIEVALKAREKLPELSRIEPPEADIDTSDMPREEREALAMSSITRKKDSA
jgi:hypothetical protein